MSREHWQRFDLGDIPQSIWDGATVDGRILGVPLFTNTLHFFYNSGILAQYGIEPPDNYDELLAACDTLRSEGFDDPFNMNVNFAGAREIEFNSILTSLGGTLIHDDNTPGWNNETGLRGGQQAPGGIRAVHERRRPVHVDRRRAGRASRRHAADGQDLGRPRLVDGRPRPIRRGRTHRVRSLAPHQRRDCPQRTRRSPSTCRSRLAAPPPLNWQFSVAMAGADLESQNAAAAHTTVARLSATHPNAPRNSAVAARSIAEGVGPRTKSPALSIARDAISQAVWAIIQHGADPADELARAETAYIEQATKAGHL